MAARPVAEPYDINLDVKFDQLERIDVGAEGAAVEPWSNQTLTQVNDSVVRLGVVEGDFHWHKHEAEDEFFLVSRASSTSTSRTPTRSCSACTRV